MFVNDICEQNQKLLKETDIILASYPRSGNTWMRLLLSDIILQSQGFKTQLGGNFIPDIYKEKLDIWNRDPRLKKVPVRIIKSHEFYDTRYVNSIYLFRKPADALCSFYYYLLGYPEQREELQKQGIDDFCKVKVEQWRTHVESYIEAKDKKSDKVLFISYESLKEKPEIILRKTTRKFLGLNITSRMCQIAVENQKFEGLQRIQKLEDTSQLGFWEAGGYQNFFRKGKVNSSKDELAQSTIDFLEANAMAIYNLALSIEKLDFQKESNQGMAMIKDKIEDLVSLGKQSSLAVRLNGVLSNKNEGAVSQVQIHHQKESEQYKLQLQQTQAELAQSQSQLQQTQAELAQSQSQLQQIQGEAQEYQSQLHQTQEVLEQFQDQMQQAETLLQEYQGQLHSTQTELEQSQSQLHSTQAELEQSQSQLHSTQAELEQSQSQLHSTQAVLEQSQSQLRSTEAVLEQSQSQLHQNRAELAHKNSQLHQSEWELERSRFQLHQTQAELTQCNSQVEHIQLEAERLRVQIGQVQGELEQSQSKLRSSSMEWKRAYSQLVQVLGELEQSQVQQRQTEAILQQSQSQNHQLQHELKRFYSQLVQLQEESQNYQSQLVQVQEESQNYQSQLVQVQEESQNYQSQLVQVQEESQHYQSQLVQVQEESQHYQSQLVQVQEESQHYQSQLVQVQEELDRSHFQQYALSDTGVESQMPYTLLVWDAWYAYQNGDVTKMQKCLHNSLKCTPFSRTETLINWLESFSKFSSENEHQLDTYALTNSEEWKHLMRQAIAVKPVGEKGLLAGKVS